MPLDKRPARSRPAIRPHRAAPGVVAAGSPVGPAHAVGHDLALGAAPAVVRGRTGERAPPRRLAVRLAPLALLAGAALVAAAPYATRPLPGCDAAEVHALLDARLGEIPALAGHDPRLLAIADARTRGHAGDASLRACQGELVSSAGRGALEYSIRRLPGGGGVRVRPELFQGGWREELR